MIDFGRIRKRGGFSMIMSDFMLPAFFPILLLAVFFIPLQMPLRFIFAVCQEHHKTKRLL